MCTFNYSFIYRRPKSQRSFVHFIFILHEKDLDSLVNDRLADGAAATKDNLGPSFYIYTPRRVIVSVDWLLSYVICEPAGPRTDFSSSSTSSFYFIF